MFKLFFAFATVAVFALQSAVAGDCCCSSAASAPADESASFDSQPATSAEQAQRSQSSRSFSVEPSTTDSYYRPMNDGFYAGRINQDPRIIGSYGHRPASDKAIGKY